MGYNFDQRSFQGHMIHKVKRSNNRSKGHAYLTWSNTKSKGRFGFLIEFHIQQHQKPTGRWDNEV
jgi:hypothetical protein